MTDDGPDVDGELLDAIEEVIVEHGPDDPISSGAIADELDGYSDGSSGNIRTREAIRVLIEERAVPIASTNRGYFYLDPARPDLLEEYLDRLDGRIRGIEKRKATVARAFNRARYARDEDGSIEVRYDEDDVDEAERAATDGREVDR